MIKKYHQIYAYDVGDITIAKVQMNGGIFWIIRINGEDVLEMTKERFLEMRMCMALTEGAGGRDYA